MPNEPPPKLEGLRLVLTLAVPEEDRTHHCETTPEMYAVYVEDGERLSGKCMAYGRNERGEWYPNPTLRWLVHWLLRRGGFH